MPKTVVPRLGKISVTLHYINKGDMNGTMTLGEGLVITILVVVLLIALAVLEIYYLRKMLKANDGKVPQEPCHTPEHSCSGCCGGTECFHAKLKQKPHIVYFEDQELDRFRQRNGEDYTPGELQEWQEVLQTLRPEEVSAWARSIRLRRLPIPKAILTQLEQQLNREA